MSRENKTVNVSDKGGLDDDKVIELREAFALFDEDSSGTLGKRELHVLLQAIGRNMDMQEIEDKIAQQKSNEDGNDTTTRPDELN